MCIQKHAHHKYGCMMKIPGYNSLLPSYGVHRLNSDVSLVESILT